MKIAFLGLGNMGTPMARNLLKASFTLHAYNRSPEKLEEIKSQGAQVFHTPGDAVADADAEQREQAAGHPDTACRRGAPCDGDAAGRPGALENVA